MSQHTIRDVRTEEAGLLSVPDDLAHQLDVFYEMVMRELRDELSALTYLRLHDNRHAAIDGVTLEVYAGDILELGSRVRHCLELIVNLLVKAIENSIDRCSEDLIFILEVEINRTVGHTGPSRDRTDG